MIPMKDILEEISRRSRLKATEGTVASYIPELAKADPEAFGLAVTECDGSQYLSGNWDHPFTLQSISKIVTLALALEERGPERIFSSVGTSPTADPFNSIMRLEMDAPHRPNNPLINSGAIVVVSLLPEEGRERKVDAIMDLCRKLMANDSIDIDDRVYRSEKNTSDRNRSLAYFLRSVGSLNGDIEDILDVYFRQCSIKTCAKDLSIMGATFACDGLNPISGKQIISPSTARTVRAIMTTCGMYDGSGEFAVKVGIPAKSGVGGGILGTVPGRMGIGVVSPPLDEKGNSVAGLAAMKEISEKLRCRVL
jgi:glutaminase